MVSSTIDSTLEALQFTADLTIPFHVLLARHAADSFRFFQPSVGAFEEYQRFQSANYFAKCRYIVSFLGLPKRGNDATFGGIYEVLGRIKRGELGFREPEGDPEVIRACAGQDYLYSLARLRQYDFLRTKWDIRWELPGTAQYLYFRQGLSVVTLRLEEPSDLESMKLAVRREVVLESVAYTLDPDELFFPEGAAAYERHLRRERNAALVSYLKNRAKATKMYHCFICSFDFAKTYGIDYIECHHTIPVSEMKPGDQTRPDDCVLLCANCHRAVHKHPNWLSKSELHEVLSSEPDTR